MSQKFNSKYYNEYVNATITRLKEKFSCLENYERTVIVSMMWCDYKKNGMIDIFCFAVLISDGYFMINNEKNNNIVKFFKVITRLPQKLQVKTIYSLIGKHRTYVPAKDFNSRFKEIIFGQEDEPYEEGVPYCKDKPREECVSDLSGEDKC